MTARRPKDPDRAGLVERLLFSVMGPPQVGDVNAPPTVPAEPSDALCHRCAQPWEAHARVHTGSMTYRPCPTQQLPPGGGR